MGNLMRFDRKGIEICFMSITQSYHLRSDFTLSFSSMQKRNLESSELLFTKCYVNCKAHSIPSPPLTPLQTHLLRTRIRTNRLIGKLPKQIRQMIYRRRHQPNHRLKRRLVRRTGMAPTRDKRFCSAEGFRHSLTVGGL